LLPGAVERFEMLVLRYFLYVGGGLLALLLLCAAVIPTPPAGDNTVVSASDTPAIRIHSAQKWPDRVVLDTSTPMPASAKLAQAGPSAESQAGINTSARDAYAQLPPDAPKPQVVAEAKKPVIKRKVARARAVPQPYPQPNYYGYAQYPQGRVQVAQQPRFGLLW
jgi:hypothetical protein